MLLCRLTPTKASSVVVTEQKSCKPGNPFVNKQTHVSKSGKDIVLANFPCASPTTGLDCHSPRLAGMGTLAKRTTERDDMRIPSLVPSLHSSVCGPAPPR